MANARTPNLVGGDALSEDIEDSPGKRSINFYCCGWMHSGRRFGPLFSLVVGLITAALRCMSKRVGVARSWLGTGTMSGKPTRLISV